VRLIAQVSSLALVAAVLVSASNGVVSAAAAAARLQTWEEAAPRPEWVRDELVDVPASDSPPAIPRETCRLREGARVAAIVIPLFLLGGAMAPERSNDPHEGKPRPLIAWDVTGGRQLSAESAEAC
jgi:hypothetical protein